MFRILLVDDEPNILQALKRGLAQLKPEELDGARPMIEAFTSGAEALKRADLVNFDLVISDYRMPQMDGVEFLTQLIGKQPNVARVILSGYTDLKAIITAVNDIQIFRYLTKPWYDAELRWIVRQALSQRAMHLENQRLADQVRAQSRYIDRQRLELERLEAESPGITRIERDVDGAILIEDDDSELEFLAIAH